MKTKANDRPAQFPVIVSREQWFARERPTERPGLGVIESEYRVWKMRCAAWEGLRKDRLFEPSPDKTLNDYLGWFQVGEANWEVGNLLLLAGRGEGPAQRELALIAIKLAESLDGLKTRSREIRELAAHSVFWPKLQTPFRGLFFYNSQNSWPVGEKLLAGFKGLGQHWDALKEATRGGQGVARKWALKLLLEVESARNQPITGADELDARLRHQPISEWRREALKLQRIAVEEGIVREWIKVCHQLFKAKTNGTPEGNRELASLVKGFRGKRFNPTTGKIIGEKADRGALIWDRIKDSIERLLGIHRAQRRKNLEI